MPPSGDKPPEKHKGGFMRNNAPLTVRLPQPAHAEAHTLPSATELELSPAAQARIKKLMQSDDDVGKVAKASPVLIGEGGRWTAACRAHRQPPGQAHRRTAAPHAPQPRRWTCFCTAWWKARWGWRRGAGRAR